MKYVVNKRGRAISIEDKDLQTLLDGGFIQITSNQYQERSYYPEYDRGPTYTSQTKTHQKSTESSKQTENIFKTVVV